MPSRPISSTDRTSLLVSKNASSPEVLSVDHQPPHFPDRLSQALLTPPADFRPSKPKLLELRMIESVIKARGTSQETLGLNASGLQLAQDDLNKILAEHTEKLRESCEHTQNAGVWDTLRKIGAAILATVSTFLGLTLFSAGAGTLLGGALIVSGVLTIANLAFTDAGLWNWLAEKLADDNEEKQKQIATLIPCVIGVVACGIGFASLAAFGMWGVLPAMPRALAIVQTAANILTITGAAGGQISQSRVSLSKASLQDMQNQMGLHQHQVEQLSEHIDQIMEQETEMQRYARTLLNLTIQTKQALLA